MKLQVETAVWLIRIYLFQQYRYSWKLYSHPADPENVPFHETRSFIKVFTISSRCI